MAKNAFQRQLDSDQSNKGHRLMMRHKVKSGETLSAIAQEYYGSGSKEMWMKIYNANKAIIGDNPSALKVGQELLIPTLKK